MKDLARKIVRDIPFLILILNGISVYVQYQASIDPDYEYYTHIEKYYWLYFLVPQFHGFGLLIVIHLIYYAWRHKYCAYSWACIIGLGVLNLVNIAHYFLKFSYLETYSGAIVIICLIFALILRIIK